MAATVPAVQHQAPQPFPKIDSPAIDTTTGCLERAWYYLVFSMWQKLGKNYSYALQTIFFQETADNSDDIDVKESWDNDDLGKLEFSQNATGAVQVQALGASPFTFVAPSAGVLAVSSGSLEISRDGGQTYYAIGAAGGAPALRAKDQCLVSWSGAAPVVAFFPSTTDAST